MPMNVNRLAEITLDVLAERPDEVLTLGFAPYTIEDEIERLVTAIGQEATTQGMVIGTTVRHHPDAHRLIVTRLDHRPRPGQQHREPTTR